MLKCRDRDLKCITIAMEVYFQDASHSIVRFTAVVYVELEGGTVAAGCLDLGFFL